MMADTLPAVPRSIDKILLALSPRSIGHNLPLYTDPFICFHKRSRKPFLAGTHKAWAESELWKCHRCIQLETLMWSGARVSACAANRNSRKEYGPFCFLNTQVYAPRFIYFFHEMINLGHEICEPQTLITSITLSQYDCMERWCMIIQPSHKGKIKLHSSCCQFYLEQN